MDRLWARVGVRATSVGLLLAGLVGGVQLEQSRHPASAPVSLVQTDADDLRLLKQRQSEHVAARAWQRQAEGAAAEKAADTAADAAAKAHRLETTVVTERKAAEARRAEAAAGPVAYTGPIPASCDEFSGSRAIGCTLMLNAGFAIDQFPCLNKLWTKESGWNYRATNKSSGAYGIPQAYPGEKMASAGSDWKTSPATQIKWGLGYIEGRYHTPCAAWAKSESTGSY